MRTLHFETWTEAEMERYLNRMVDFGFLSVWSVQEWGNGAEGSRFAAWANGPGDEPKRIEDPYIHTNMTRMSALGWLCEAVHAYNQEREPQSPAALRPEDV